MTPGPYFSHNGIHLRFPGEKDLPLIQALRNDQTTWTHLTDPRPVGPADQKAWLESLGLSRGRYCFVAGTDNLDFVGLVRMDEHDPIHRSLRVGADVVPKLRGHGLGTRIYEAIIRVAFGQLNIHRLWLQVLPTNPALRLYLRLGFQEEGRLRDAVFRDGHYVDYIVMSILEGEQRR